MVLALTPLRWSLISWRTNASSAMSMANAIRVRSAARKDSRLATSVTITCSENEKRNAMKVTAAAVLPIVHNKGRSLDKPN